MLPQVPFPRGPPHCGSRRDSREILGCHRKLGRWPRRKPIGDLSNPGLIWVWLFQKYSPHLFVASTRTINLSGPPEEATYCSLTIFPGAIRRVVLRKATFLSPMESSPRYIKTSPSNWPVSIRHPGASPLNTYSL